MNFGKLLYPESVAVGLKANDAIEAITAMVDLLAYAGRLRERDQVLEAVIQRELARPTGLGDGLAVPHGKSDGCDRMMMAIARPERPINFGSKDGIDCSFLVLLVSPPDTTAPHITALSKISRLWLSPPFRETVMQATSGRDIYEAMINHPE